MLKSRYVLHILDFFGGLCFKCRKSHDEEDVPGVAFGYIHKGLRLGTSEMDRLHGSEVKNLLRERKLVLILDLDHTLINSIRLHDISAAGMDLGIQTGNCCIRKSSTPTYGNIGKWTFQDQSETPPRFQQHKNQHTTILIL